MPRPRASLVYKHPDAHMQRAINELYLAIQRRRLRVEELDLENLAFRLGPIFKEGQIGIIERLRDGDLPFRDVLIVANEDGNLLQVTNQNTTTTFALVRLDNANTVDGVDVIGTDENWKIDIGGNFTAILADLNFAGGYRQYLDGWGANSLAANVGTPTKLDRYGGGTAAPWNETTLMRGGSITGISARYSDSVTSGEVLVEPFIDGVGTGRVARITSGQQDITLIGKDFESFSSGAVVDLRYTTSSAFAPTGKNLQADLEIET